MPVTPGVAAAAYACSMRSGRGRVDYALQKRALLAQLATGHVGVDDVCDASPYLVRAAKFHGVPTEVPCPICRKEPLTHVHWVYGDALGARAGTARAPSELEAMAVQYADFTVYQVEVCRSCSWNHLVASFMLGTGEPSVGRRAPKRAAR